MGSVGLITVALIITLPLVIIFLIVKNLKKK